MRQRPRGPRVDEIVGRGPSGAFAVAGIATAIVVRSCSRSTSSCTCRGGPSNERRGAAGRAGPQATAIAAERRWAVVVAIIAALVLMMIVTGLHWASMPPSRVETIDVKTLHLKGEFVESNLGTSSAPTAR